MTVAGLIVKNATTELLELATGITEETNPGITALLTASQAKVTAYAELKAANTALAAAQTAVNNLDLDTAAITALEAVGAGMTVVTPADAEAPTTAEIAQEIAGLAALATTAQATLDAANAAAALTQDAVTAAIDADADVTAAIAAKEGADADVTAAFDDIEALDYFDTDIDTTEEALIDGIAQLKTNLATVVAFDSDETTTAGLLEAFTTAAVTAGFISADDETAILAAYTDADPTDDESHADALVAAIAAVDDNNQINEFDALVTIYTDAVAAAESAQDDLDDAIAAAITEAELDDAIAADEAAVTAATAAVTAANTAVSDFAALVSTYDTAAAAENPLTDALAAAELAVKTAQNNIDALAKAVADLADATALVTEMTELQDAITAATAAFTDNDFAAPVTLTAGTKYATAADDIFLINDTVAAYTIANFNLLGDDVLYIGTDYTFNDGELTDGNNSVLEVFLSEVGGNAVLTFETKEFGSNSTDPEFTVTLTGISMEDVNIADGFVTVA